MMNYPTIVKRAGLLAIALLAVSCSESVGPERGSVGAPLFSFSANGITLRTDNGSLGYSGQVIRKGFDHQDANHRVINPLPGDAVVATFYWITPTGNSSNIITSVRDVYTDAALTPIGNTYHLVDFITANGIAMATYVATNVQFDSTRGYVFAVEANFGVSIPDGGVKMTDWTGVENVYPTALGSFHSTSISASTPTPIAPGPITIGAGSLAYGVTLSNGGVNMGSRPAGWVVVGGGIGSDGQLQDDGDYLPPGGGGTINPQWTWDFQRASTALATVLELKPGTNGTPTGNLSVTTSTTGSNLDPDGYTITVDGGSPQAIGINGSVSYSNLPAGSHAVAISGVAGNCTVSGGTSQTVTVPSGGTATAAFSVSCSATTGNLTVTTSTSGSNLDPDGYTVTVDGGSAQAIGISGSVSYTNLAAGNHTVAISGVAGNCTVSGGTSRTVSVPSGGTATTTFTVSCTAPVGNLTVTASTSGSGLDPDGYTATVDGSTSKAVATNGSVTFTGLATGSHTVVLSGVAANCTVSGGTSRTVTVTAGGTVTVTYAVSCTAPNQPPVVNAGPDATVLTGLLFTLNASFTDPNNDGPFTYRIDWGDGSATTGSMASAGTISKGHTYVTIFPRDYTIRVTVTDAHGASGSDTKVIHVILL